MNILFVYSIKESYSAEKPLSNSSTLHFGISYISSFLKKHGHKTRLLVLTEKTPLELVDNTLDNFLPSLICFTAVYSEYKFISNIAKLIKNGHPDIFLLVGGPHVSLNAEDCLSDSFDALCIGEGEEATLELVKQLEKKITPSGIPNLWIKFQDKIEKTPTRPFLQDIDNLPFPDREMWQEWLECPKDSKRAIILLGRGCPFLCSYCCNHALRKLAEGKYVRYRSTNSVIEEIKYIIDKYPYVKHIAFEVETFTINTNWAIELCSKLEEFNSRLAEPLSFNVNLRITPNMQQLEPLLSAMEKANFNLVAIGLESGSERVRKEILNRNYSNADLTNAVTSAKKHKLKIFFYIMIGIPGETEKDFKETIALVRKCLPEYYGLYVFFPYPGTELFQYAKGHNLLPRELSVERERSRAVLDLPGFSKKQISSNYVWFEYNVYKGYKPLYKILLTVLNIKRLSSPNLDKFIKKLTSNTLFYKLILNTRKLFIILTREKK